MAPPDDAHAVFVEEVVVVEHEVSGRVAVLSLKAAIVDRPVRAAPVAGASAVLRCDHRISLID